MNKDENINSTLEDKFQNAVGLLVDAASEAQNGNAKLESIDAFKSRQRLALEKQLQDLRDQYARAYQIVAEQLIGGHSIHLALTRSEKEAILNEIKAGQQNLYQAIESNTLEKAMEEGKTFQHILGYSRNTLEKFYAVGVECLEQTEYEKARDIFSLLVLINPGYHNFWVSLILCQQALGNWNAALQACSLAEATDEKDPLPYLYASECYVELNNRLQAIEEVEKAIRYAGEHPEKELIEITRAAKEWKQQLLKIA